MKSLSSRDSDFKGKFPFFLSARLGGRATGFGGPPDLLKSEPSFPQKLDVTFFSFFESFFDESFLHGSCFAHWLRVLADQARVDGVGPLERAKKYEIWCFDLLSTQHWNVWVCYVSLISLESQ